VPVQCLLSPRTWARRTTRRRTQSGQPWLSQQKADYPLLHFLADLSETPRHVSGEVDPDSYRLTVKHQVTTRRGRQADTGPAQDQEECGNHQDNADRSQSPKAAPKAVAGGADEGRRHLARSGARVLHRDRDSTHSANRTCATPLLARCVHPKWVQELLRHARIGTATGLHSHVTPEMMDQVASERWIRRWTTVMAAVNEKGR
jgi:hypothetical protein